MITAKSALKGQANRPWLLLPTTLHRVTCRKHSFTWRGSCQVSERMSTNKPTPLGHSSDHWCFLLLFQSWLSFNRNRSYIYNTYAVHMVFFRLLSAMLLASTSTMDKRPHLISAPEISCHLSYRKLRDVVDYFFGSSGTWVMATRCCTNRSWACDSEVIGGTDIAISVEQQGSPCKSRIQAQQQQRQ